MILERWQTNRQGKELTSIKVGGALAYYSRPKTLEELREDLQAAQAEDLPYRVIGGGSNLLFADAGFKGLVIQPAFTQLRIIEDAAEYAPFLKDLQEHPPATPRYTRGEESGALRLDARPKEEVGETVLVEMGAGVPWGQAVMWSLQQQLSGLHWYARIPCQVGGAAFNNIHGEKHFVSHVICAVRALDVESGEERVFGQSDLDFGYDHSRFHSRGEIITAVIFALEKLSPTATEENRRQYLDWTAAKSTVQPSGANCGSVFQNLTEEQAREAGETPLAAAWYVDQCGLKGRAVGGMQVYSGHANFIVNSGTGTQADFIQLVQEVRQAVKERFGIWIEPEVECVNEQGERLQW